MKLAGQVPIEIQLALSSHLWDYKNKSPLLAFDMGPEHVTYWALTPALHRDSLEYLVHSPISAYHFEGNKYWLPDPTHVLMRLKPSDDKSHEVELNIPPIDLHFYIRAWKHTAIWWGLLKPMCVLMLRTTDSSLSCLCTLKSHEDMCGLASFLLLKSTYLLFFPVATISLILCQQFPWVPV